jgi:hypothetical protein
MHPYLLESGTQKLLPAFCTPAAKTATRTDASSAVTVMFAQMIPPACVDHVPQTDARRSLETQGKPAISKPSHNPSHLLLAVSLQAGRMPALHMQ